MGALKTAFALLLLCLAIFAGGCDELPNSYAETCGLESFDDCGGATLFISSAFMLVSLAIGLAYMYAKLKENPAIEMWAKDEASNLVITVFLFIGLVGFFQASCMISESYFDASPFQSANDYLDGLINTNGLGIIRTLTYGSLHDQFDATRYIYLGAAPIYGVGVATNAYRKGLSAHKELVMDMYLPIIASLNAQKYILQTIQWAGASIVLPFAFIMRIIPMTREFGNVLIAIFFTAYIVVPFLYALSHEIYAGIADSEVPCVSCSYVRVHNFYTYGLDGISGFDDSTLSGKGSIFYKIGITIPQAVFIPNLVLVVSITCVMALSKALKAMAVG